MRKCNYAYWMLLSVLGGSMLLAAPALAEKTCPWLQKILAAKDDEFRAFKGDELEGSSDGISFKGTLELNVTGKAKEEGCSLVVRRVDNATGQELEPSYDCIIAWESTFAQASADYESIGGKLRDCLPEVAFDDARKGNPSEYSAVWTFSGETNGAKIEMGLADWVAMTETLSGKPLSGRPGIGVTLRVYNKSPLRAGLGIEVPVMSVAVAGLSPTVK